MAKTKKTAAEPTKPPEQAPEADRLALWRSRIARARKLREDWVQKYEVERGERYFLGDQEGRERGVFNFTGATIRTKRPNLLFSAPRFYVRPRAGRAMPTLERVAATGEGVLATIADREDHLAYVARLGVHQAYFRIGVLKVCYDPTLVENPRKGEPMVATTDGGEPVMDAAGEPVPLRSPTTGAVLTEPDTVLTDDVYRWDWVDAAAMLLPDEGPDRTKWTWIGEEITVPLEAAKRDPRFKHRKDSLKANTNRRGDTATGGRRRTSVAAAEESEDFFRYVEVYDYEAGRLLIDADAQEADAFLVDEPLPDWIERDPYALLVLGEPIVGPEPSPWPVPVVRDWLPIQDDQNVLRRMVSEGAKRSARKILHEKATFPDQDEATKALQSPIDMEAAEVRDLLRPPVMLVAPDVNPAVYKGVGLADQTWRLVTGQTGARQADPDGETATEAGFAERAADIRDAADQALVATWLAMAGRKMFQCVQATLTVDLWIKLRTASDSEVTEYLTRVYHLPPEVLSAAPQVKDLLRHRLGDERWLRITREQLAFEADVTVAPGSTRPKNLDAERANWLKFLSALGAAPQLALSRELLGRTMRMFDMEDPRLLDELVALAERMVQVNATQAGRAQGGASQGAPPATNGAMGGSLSTVLAGAQAGRPQA